jgi:N-glycosidase YbiA
MDQPIYFYTKTGAFFELSNFAPFGFEAYGVYWSTVEHYFQAQKFLDNAHRERIRKAASPRDARALGQSRQFPLRPGWDEAREEVMLYALRLKFKRPELRRILVNTGSRPLVEASPFDYFWGAGQDGSGLNRLGRLLEQVRTELQSADDQHDGAPDTLKPARR